MERGGMEPVEAARWGSSMITEEDVGMSLSNRLRLANESGK